MQVGLIALIIVFPQGNRKFFVNVGSTNLLQTQLSKNTLNFLKEDGLTIRH